MDTTLYSESSDPGSHAVSFGCSGLTLETFVQKDLGNASVEVLAGVVSVELDGQMANHTLGPGDRLKVHIESVTHRVCNT